MVSSRAKIEQTLTELQTQVTALRARHYAGEGEDQPPENRGAISKWSVGGCTYSETCQFVVTL